MTPAGYDDDRVFELVARILSSHLGIAQSAIRREQRLQEDLGVDSLDACELLLRIEDETGATVAFDSASVLERLGTVAAVVRSLAGASVEAPGLGMVVGP
jgi:acyl carrier protein